MGRWLSLLLAIAASVVGFVFVANIAFGAAVFSAGGSVVLGSLVAGAGVISGGYAMKTLMVDRAGTAIWNSVTGKTAQIEAQTNAAEVINAAQFQLEQQEREEEGEGLVKAGFGLVAGLIIAGLAFGAFMSQRDQEEE